MDNRFVVLTEYFRANNAGRRKEINKSIEINCRTPQIKRVIIFIDPEVEFTSSLKKVLSEENYKKIELHHTKPQSRSTYSDFFSYANKNLVGENCILCNNDISFDESLDLIISSEDFDLSGHFICLTRWDVMRDNSLRFKQPARIRKNSQDAWIFKSPLPLKMVEKGEFYMGRPGCDGMTSYLAAISGLKILNPSEKIVAAHRHFSKYRTYGRKHRMGGDDIYMCVYPTDKLHYDKSKVLYKFNEPERGYLYGNEAVNRAIEREKNNEIHWNWAIEKCRSR